MQWISSHRTVLKSSWCVFKRALALVMTSFTQKTQREKFERKSSQKKSETHHFFFFFFHHVSHCTVLASFFSRRNWNVGLLIVHMAAFQISDKISTTLCMLLDKVTLPSSTFSHHTKVSFHRRANAYLHRLALPNVCIGTSWVRFWSESCGTFQPLIGSYPESVQLWAHWERRDTVVLIPVQGFIFEDAVLHSSPKRRRCSFRAWLASD